MSSLTIPTPAPTSAEGPDARLELVEVLDTAAAELSAVAASTTAGLSRRAGKLSRQLSAAARLAGNGTGVPPAAGALARVARSTARIDPASPYVASTVDGLICALSSLIVTLHDWRGHRACLPADD